MNCVTASSKSREPAEPDPGPGCPYRIRPRVLHPTKRSDVTRGGYRRAQFQEAWARLLQKPTKESNTRTL